MVRLRWYPAGSFGAAWSLVPLVELWASRRTQLVTVNDEAALVKLLFDFGRRQA
jgi:hypothetical protein